MFSLPNFSHRLKNQTSENRGLAITVCGMGIWVGIRCILDALNEDKQFFVLGMVFFLFLLWRGWSISKANESRKHDFPLLLSTLIWIAWMAYRGVDFFQWWLPLMALTLFIASYELVYFVVLINIILVMAMMILSGRINQSLDLLGSAIAISTSIALYRRFKEDHETQLKESIRNLQISHDAAKIWHIEFNPDGRVLYISKSLLEKLGFQDMSKQIFLHDIFHPGDHSTLDKARLSSTRLSTGEIDPMASCDCRINGGSKGALWVHAQFARALGADAKLIVGLRGIDERLRMEDLIRDNQRKIASQAAEIASQFEAAKSTLHARQEVERLAQHDLRSPLRSIESAAAALRRGRLLTNTEEHLLTSIERTAARALSMVTMSLDLYRMEEGTFKFSPETIDLVSIGRNVVGELFNHARSKNLHLDFNTPVESLEATGNNLLTTSIVENLVRNAMEAAPENSTVTMALYQGARVGLLIHNEGVVHESIRKDFFKKYATHGKRGGLGLGTYSARLIARAQGGDLTMTTSDERGTLLILKLNRRENETIKDDENHVIPESFGPSLPGNLVDMALPSKSRSKQLPIEILVVEDDDYNWMLLSCWLPRHSGVRRVINGREAIEALNVRRPDIVIMDIEMPIMTGFEAVYQIREMQKSVAEEPSMIYAFTGYDDIETTESIKNAGFDGILKKPITQKEIEELLSTYALEKAASKIENRLWIERSFMEAFPSFIESRRSLIDDIERSAESGDISNMKRAAHTLLGSPAVHGFEEGIAICKEISKLETIKDLSLVRSHVSSLRKILSNPVIR